VSLWKRLFGDEDDEDPPKEKPQPAKTRTTPRADEPPPAEVGVLPRVPSPQTPTNAAKARTERIARIRRTGLEGGYTVRQAIRVLREHAGRAEQTALLQASVEGLSRDPEGDLDPLRVACATLLDERGQRGRALALVAPVRSVPGMMLAAELFAAEGKLARAVGMLERVLARDIDTPGARERHERYRSQLGGTAARVVRHDDLATVVAPALEQETPFRLLREVARGGSGTVYLAEDELLGRRVAYKIYHQRRDQQGQLEREARLSVRLRGPGVIRVFDADPERGWIAMEWANGGSLRDRLASGRVAELLPVSDWLGDVVAALTRVHDEGLVHGDLKPANVLFCDDGRPLLTDFGACHASGEAQLAGTPGYMSPERLDGAPMDPRDDVYGFGRILEDILGARDDVGLPDDDDARAVARLALSCLAPADERPPSAHALIDLLA